MTANSTERQSVAIIDSGNIAARRLAETTGLTLINESQGKSSQTPQWAYTLLWINNQLTLRDHREKRAVDVSIDFTAGRSLHRLKFGGGHGQPIARAVKSREKPLICDATAGFGKDAFVFASLGCEVVLLERSAIVHALLADALQRAENHPETKEIVARMHLYQADSSLLPDCWCHHSLPQVAYLDPMYPDGKRTAKKGIQTLRTLLETRHKTPLETTQDDQKLLSAARATAARVVVKRPRKSAPLADAEPVGNITSPNTRYDIYNSIQR